MPFNTGAGTQVAIGKESSWGTAVADTMLLSFTGESMAPEVTKTEEENLLAGYGPSAFDLMGIKTGGEISGILKPDNAGFLMKAALGGTDTVALVTGQQQHSMVMVAPSGSLPSYTVFVNRKSAIMKYAGQKVSSLKLNAKAGDYVRYSVALRGKDESSGTIATTAAPSIKAYKFVGGTLTVGGTALDIIGCDWELNNNLEDGPQTLTSGLYMSEPAHNKRKVTLSIEIPDSAAVQTIRSTNFLTETLIATVVLHLESPAIIATTYKYRMDITMLNCAVMSLTNNVSSAGIINASITLEATDNGTNPPVSAVIYDGTAAAY